MQAVSPDVLGKDTSPNASSAFLTSRATSTVSGKPTLSDGSRSNTTQSGRSSLSTREYQVWHSMQPVLTIQSKASSSFTAGTSIVRSPWSLITRASTRLTHAGT